MQNGKLSNAPEIEDLLQRITSFTFSLMEERSSDIPYFYGEKLALNLEVKPILSNTRLVESFRRYFGLKRGGEIKMFQELFSEIYVEVSIESEVPYLSSKKQGSIYSFPHYHKYTAVSSPPNGCMRVKNVEHVISHGAKSDGKKYLVVRAFMEFKRYKSFVINQGQETNYLLPFVSLYRPIQIRRSVLRVESLVFLNQNNNNIVQFIVKNISPTCFLDVKQCQIHLIQSNRMVEGKREKVNQLFNNYLIKETPTGNINKFPLRLNPNECVSLVYEIEYLNVREFKSNNSNVMESDSKLRESTSGEEEGEGGDFSLFKLQKLCGEDLSRFKYTKNPSSFSSQNGMDYQEGGGFLQKRRRGRGVHHVFQTLCSFTYSIQNFSSSFSKFHVIQWKGVIEKGLLTTMEIVQKDEENGRFVLSCILMNYTREEFKFSVTYPNKLGDLLHCEDSKIDVDLKPMDCKRFLLAFVSRKRQIHSMKKIMFFDKIKKRKYQVPFVINILI